MASSINASTSGAGGVITTADNTGILNLQTGGTTAVTVDASQNVGIGTTSPFSAAGYKSLTINGSTTGVLAIQANGSNSCYLYSDGGAFNIKGVQNIPMDFYTNDTQRMRIDSGGAVLMGKTTTDDTNVGFAYRTAGYISVVRSAGAPCYFNRTGTDGAVVEIANDSSTVGTISVSGSSTAYNTSSDYRLKENIVPMTGALATVQALKPVTYKWKIDGSDGQGFIAHELQEVVPDCVSGEKDAVDEEGKPVHQGVDTSFLVATLTAAIQEQQTIINDLKARVTALEAK